MQPDEWLEQYNAKLQKAKENADRAKEQLGQLGATATSKDGQVTVRVNSSGVLEDITFGRDFQHPQPDRVSAAIMECVRKAQRDAAGQMMEVMQEFVGDGEALDYVRGQLPHGYAGDGTHEDDEPRTPADQQAGQQADEDDFDDNGFMR